MKVKKAVSGGGPLGTPESLKFGENHPNKLVSFAFKILKS